MASNVDSLRAYLALASGLAEVTLEKARQAARDFLAEGVDLNSAAATAEQAARGLQDQVSTMAEDLLEQGKANREALIGVVRSEVDKAVGRLGFVREEELAALRAHVMRLEAQMASGASSTAAAKQKTATKSAGKKPAATKSAAKKPAAKKSSSTKATSSGSASA